MSIVIKRHAVLLAGASALAALVIANSLVARRTERRHRPDGDFIDVNGVRLHYSDRGHGRPVVLIHGNAVTGSDWNASGVADLLLQAGHRVIIFDRPGCGYSTRPAGRLWTANRQADLLHAAMTKLGIERPIIAGHSWGAIVALGLAQRHEADLSGLVLISGYYFWTFRPDAVLAALAALPGLGDVLRYTVSPLLGWLQMPLIKKAMFTPAAVPPKFHATYATGMILRPSQIRATTADGMLMIPGALALRHGYKNIDLPVAIIAGAGDRIVFPERTEKLRDLIRGSSLRVIEGAGHMVHHIAPRQVTQVIESVIERSLAPPSSARPVARAVA